MHPTSAHTPLATASAPPGPLRVLQAGAELFPLIKTGGLADVLGALPPALAALGHDLRLVLPGFAAVVDAVLHQRTVVELGALFGAARVTVRLGRLPFSHLSVYVVDAPLLYRRSGGPYQDADGHDWPDNLQRFALLGWVAAHLATGELDPAWQPQVLHAHDWHAALACTYLQAHASPVPRVFTIHNLAYQGLFPLSDFGLLGLGSRFLGASALEYHGQLSFMKGGLKHAHRITTVSPTYAREIATPEFGAGLDGVIRLRQADVGGILNGVDEAVWNPATDAALAQRYSAERLDGKAVCKAELQRSFGLEPRPEAPLFGVVSRLSAQKGLDLVLAAAPVALADGAQLVVQGSGERGLEQALLALAASFPGQVGVRVGYDEAGAHRLIAGADVVLVPSRFEPCGLTQLYALRYGSLPLVRRVGGLADTVVGADEHSLASGEATGIAFDEASPAALADALHRAVRLYRQAEVWRGLQRQAMSRRFSWAEAARAYEVLYRSMLATPV